MSGRISSFIKPSEKYDDIYKDENFNFLGKPINDVPISRVPPLLLVKKDKFLEIKGNFHKVLGAHEAPQRRGHPRKLRRPFLQAAPWKSRILSMCWWPGSLETISEWPKLKGEEFRIASLFSSAQNLVYRLKLECKVRGNLKACDRDMGKLLSDDKKLNNNVQ